MVEEYGDRLVCDSEQRKRYKTVELIVDEAEWLDQAAPVDALMVGVLVAREETELRAQVKTEGGRWNPERQMWELRYDRVKRLGLEGRLVRDTLGDYEVFAYDVGDEGSSTHLLGRCAGAVYSDSGFAYPGINAQRLYAAYRYR